MYGDLTKATHEATKAIIAKSVAEKLGDKAGEKFIERLNAQQKFNDAKKAIDAFDAKSAKNRLEEEKLSASQIAIIEAKRKNARQELLDQAEEERQSVIKLENQYVKFGQVIDKLNQTAAPLEQKAPKKAKKVFDTPQVTGLTSTIIPAPLFDVKGIAVFNGQVDEYGNKLKSLQNIITTSMGQIHLATDTGLLALNALLYEFNQEASELIEGSLVNTFSGIGDAIGNAIATGGNVLSAIGNSLLSSLGAFLSDMGGMLIKYGLLAIAKGKIDLAILTGGPVSIGAGIAAVGVGLLLKAAGASIGNMARSGGSNSSSSTSSGSNANNSTRVSGGFSGSGGFGSGTVVFEIAGTSLIGVLNNTQARNLRIGGN